MIKVTYFPKKLASYYDAQDSILVEEYSSIHTFAGAYEKLCKDFKINSVEGLGARERMELSNIVTQMHNDAYERSVTRFAEKGVDALGDVFGGFLFKCMVMFVLLTGIPIGLAAIAFNSFNTTEQIQQSVNR